MNRKTLAIALALASPGVFMIGCGGMNETRSVAEQPLEMMEPVDYENTDTDMKTMDPVEDDVVEAVFADTTANVSAASVVPDHEKDLAKSGTAASPRPEALTLYFDSDASEVQQADLGRLTAHGEYLLQNPDVTLRVSGHTDQSGDKAYNQWLARKRAESVARVLVDYGVQPSQVEIESLGEDQPIAGLEHAVADRRVELKYLDDTRLSEADSF